MLETIKNQKTEMVKGWRRANGSFVAPLYPSSTDTDSILRLHSMHSCLTTEVLGVHGLRGIEEGVG